MHCYLTRFLTRRSFSSICDLTGTYTSRSKHFLTTINKQDHQLYISTIPYQDLTTKMHLDGIGYVASLHGPIEILISCRHIDAASYNDKLNDAVFENNMILTFSPVLLKNEKD